MRIGFFGGSFDPVHLGHVDLARHIQQAEALDQLVFLPAGQAPHKKSGARAAGSHRLEMLKLAIADNSNFCVDDRELCRAGPSYTFDTLTEIQREHPQDQLYFLIGLDSLRDLPHWYRIDELCQIVTMLVARRPGENQTEIEKMAQANPAIRFRIIDTPEHPASSSAIRRQLASGEVSIEFLDSRVESYLRVHELYGLHES